MTGPVAELLAQETLTPCDVVTLPRVPPVFRTTF